MSSLYWLIDGQMARFAPFPQSHSRPRADGKFMPIGITRLIMMWCADEAPPNPMGRTRRSAALEALGRETHFMRMMIDTTCLKARPSRRRCGKEPLQRSVSLYVVGIPCLARMPSRKMALISAMHIRTITTENGSAPITIAN